MREIDIYDPNGVVNAHFIHRRDFLIPFINAYRWETGAELGLRTGETFFGLMDACPSLVTLYGVDNWEPYEDHPHPHEQEANKLYVLEKVKGYPKGRVLQGSTHEMHAQVPDESLDFVFIDANHSIDAASLDIKFWLPRVKPAGWVFGHDINWVSVYRAVSNFSDLFMTGPDNVWGFPKVLNNK